MELLNCDLVVVGSGIAGLFCAYTFAEYGDVILLSKSNVTDCNSNEAQGGIAAVWDESDTISDHFNDTMTAGAGLCNPSAVKILVKEGPERIKELIDLGMEFDQQDGKIMLTREGAHRKKRVLHSKGDSTGREMENHLLGLVLQHPKIHVIDNFLFQDLLVENGQVLGLIGIKMPGNRPIAVNSQAVVLATGGLSAIYPETSNSTVATGDGIAAAWAAGAVVADLEFVQFHPTVLNVKGFQRVLLTEALRGEGARLTDATGKPFMDKYHPMADLAPRDVVARAIFTEMTSSGKDHVYLDCRHMGESFLRERFPKVFGLVEKAGLCLAKDLIPISPAAHYSMGGILTDLHGRTSLKGLYAAGEAACTGVHGANRLASNSLLECLVFGKRAALAVKKDSNDRITLKNLNKFKIWTLNSFPVNEIHKMMAANLGIIRTQVKLQNMLNNMWHTIDQKQHRSVFPLLSPEKIMCRNMTALAALIAKAALTRTESRGSHFREDFPAPDQSWLCRIAFTNTEIKKIPIG